MAFVRTETGQLPSRQSSPRTCDVYQTNNVKILCLGRVTGLTVIYADSAVWTTPSTKCSSGLAVTLLLRSRVKGSNFVGPVQGSLPPSVARLFLCDFFAPVLYGCVHVDERGDPRSAADPGVE